MEHLEPGWYPDPDGADVFRYWDGAAWSRERTQDPASPPPRATEARDPKPRRIGIVVGVLVAVVVLAVLGGLGVARSGRSEGTLPERVGTAASDPYDQSSSPDSVAPSASSTASEESVACPRGNPNQRSTHPRDDRVHGGGWSFAEVDGFEKPAPESRMTFAWDVAQQVKPVSAEPSWIAQVAVGQLRSADGFDRDAERTADEVMDCVVSSDLYSLRTGARRDTSSAAVEVDGRAGWRIESDIAVDQPGLSFGGDHVTIIVARDDDDWSLFFSATPLGDVALAKTAGDVASDLRID